MPSDWFDEYNECLNVLLSHRAFYFFWCNFSSPRFTMSLQPCNDDEFGPVVHGCRGDYDFTIFFEQIFFELTLSLIIVVICLIRLFLLFKQPKKTAGGFLLYSKSVSFGAGRQMTKKLIH